MMGPIVTSMDPNVKLFPEEGKPLPVRGRYQRIIGKLNYLIITRQYVTFSVSVLSQFLDFDGMQLFECLDTSKEF